VKVDVRSNIAEVQRALDLTQAEVGKAATSRAINKVAITVRAEAAKDIRSVYNITAATAKGNITIRRATANNPAATVTASGRRLPLLAFAARQTAKGVSVKVLVAGARKVVAHAFIETAHSNIRGVLLRRGPSRYPLKFLTSLGVAQAFGAKRVQTILAKTVAERFPIVYRQELKFALNGGRSPLQVK
jgi:Prophage minor tail protein Z (GPZ)